MPAIEVTSFTSLTAFSSDLQAAKFEQFINIMKATEGCSSIHHGFQLQDSSKIYIIIAWASYDVFMAAGMHEGKTLVRSELEKLSLSFDSLSDEVFEYAVDPAASLNAPLPELRYTSPKLGSTATDVDSYAAEFRAQVKNNDHAGLEFAAIPTWYQGLPKSNAGPNLYLMGWPSLEDKDNFLHKLAPSMKFMDGIHKRTHMDIKPLSLVKA